MPKLRLHLFSNIDLSPQDRYLDRIIDAKKPLVIAAIENEELDNEALVSTADIQGHMLDSLRSTTWPRHNEIVNLPHSVLIDDFKTILSPEDPGVGLFLAALEGDRDRMEEAWESMSEEGRARYANLAAEALALAPEFFGYRHRMQWLDPMLAHLDLDQLADRVMPTAALEVRTKQNSFGMRETISNHMKSSEDTEVVPRRRGGERS